jgi:cysteinyl-tRNA synthetase
MEIEVKTVYLCGPTLYSDIHIGNARSLVLFDVIAEYHRRTGGVKYARNITDVDDKILALCGNENPGDWVERETISQFRRDERALGLKSPDIEPRASWYISEMQSMIGMMTDSLIYRDDGVYFDPSTVSGYGALSNRTTKTPFAVWKFDPNGWGSRWGNGRPGWHTECTAMILGIFGGAVDIHGGGADLKFPHHENENCQCVAVTGSGVAKSWLHVGQVMVNSVKMSKSVGNVMTVNDLSKDWSTGAMRVALLMSDYRKPIDMTVARLQEAEKVFAKRPETAWLSDVEWSDQQFKMMRKGYVTRF